MILNGCWTEDNDRQIKQFKVKTNKHQTKCHHKTKQISLILGPKLFIWKTCEKKAFCESSKSVNFT